MKIDNRRAQSAVFRTLYHTLYYSAYFHTPNNWWFFVFFNVPQQDPPPPHKVDGPGKVRVQALATSISRQTNVGCKPRQSTLQNSMVKPQGGNIDPFSFAHTGDCISSFSHPPPSLSRFLCLLLSISILADSFPNSPSSLFPQPSSFSHAPSLQSTFLFLAWLNKNTTWQKLLSMIIQKKTKQSQMPDAFENLFSLKFQNDCSEPQVKYQIKVRMSEETHLMELECGGSHSDAFQADDHRAGVEVALAHNPSDHPAWCRSNAVNNRA